MSDYRITAAAEAMRAKRRELIAQPLDRIWLELAAAGVAAFEEAMKTSAAQNLERLSRGGAN